MNHETEAPFKGEMWAREGCPYVVMHREFSQEYAVHVAGMPAAVATCRTLEDALAMADAMDRDAEDFVRRY